jgi:hypothetical protein
VQHKKKCHLSSLNQFISGTNYYLNRDLTVIENTQVKVIWSPLRNTIARRGVELEGPTFHLRF